MVACRSVLALGIAASGKKDYSQFRKILQHASLTSVLKEERDLNYDEVGAVCSCSGVASSHWSEYFIFL